MNFEELQKAWRSQGSDPRPTLDADLLLKEVQRNKRLFEATLFWRDVMEIGGGFLLTPLFLYRGVRDHEWPYFLMALACLGVGVFMLVDRWLQRRKKPATSDPLRACIEASLIQVNHQIWLLRNVLWWYLLPLGVGIGIFIGFIAWQLRSAGAVVFVWVGRYALICALLYWGIYWLNQRTVQKGLKPRRRELEALLASLGQ